MCADPSLSLSLSLSSRSRYVYDLCCLGEQRAERSAEGGFSPLHGQQGRAALSGGGAAAALQPRAPEGRKGAELVERFGMIQQMLDGAHSLEEMAWRSGLGYAGVSEVVDAFPARLVRVALPAGRRRKK